MRTLGRVMLVVFAFTFAVPIVPVSSAESNSVDEFAGLWKAKKRFGPDAGGPLIVQKNGNNYTADMMGRTLPMRMEGAELTFDLPNNEGEFRGRFDAKEIAGHWYQPGTPVNGGDPAISVEATPVRLAADGANRWSGTVVPLQDEFTFYLMVEKRPDGAVRWIRHRTFAARDQTGNEIGARAGGERHDHAHRFLGIRLRACRRQCSRREQRAEET